ncbi:MAG TPA: hypothetical protein VIU94_14070, partial [Streptomyces sp.]
QTSGDISRDTVMRQLPFDIDVTAEQKKIDVERVRDSLGMSMASLAQAIPQMAMGGADPTPIIMKMATYAQALQKGDSPEDAAAKAFPPPPPAPAQNPQEEAAEAGPGAPPGAGPEGGLPPELAGLLGGGGGAPQQGGAGQDLLMGLAGMTAAGKPNLQMNVSTRRPI